MDLRIQNQSQTDIDSTTNLKSGNTQSASARAVSSDALDIQSIDASQDTTSISGSTVQLSNDVPIRQDRVDALRAQIEGGTYTVNAHAIATAMFQNLFRS